MAAKLVMLNFKLRSHVHLEYQPRQANSHEHQRHHFQDARNANGEYCGECLNPEAILMRP